MKKPKARRKSSRKASKRSLKSSLPRNLTGPAIKRIRMAASPKITQDDMVGRLARHGLILTQAMIAKLENRHRPINDFELSAIAKALRVSVQAIMDQACARR